MYPVVKIGVSFDCYLDEHTGEIRYIVENAKGKQFDVTKKVYYALLKADGTRPLDLQDGGAKLLPDLKRYGLVSTSRFSREAGLFNRFILCPFRNKTRKPLRFLQVFNSLIPLLALAFFAWGRYLQPDKIPAEGFRFNLLPYLVLVVFSLFMHEVGHLLVSLSYGGHIGDLGVLLIGVIPVGAYVSCNEYSLPERSQKIRFFLGGVMMNFLMAAVFYVLSMLIPEWHLQLYTTFIFNLIMIVVNLFPVRGLDGERLLFLCIKMKKRTKTIVQYICGFIGGVFFIFDVGYAAYGLYRFVSGLIG